MEAGPRRRTNVNWVDVDGDVVAVDADDGTVHTMKGATAVLWQILDGMSLDGVEADLCAVLGIPAERAHADVVAALDQLLRAGLVGGAAGPRRSPDGGGSENLAGEFETVQRVDGVEHDW